MIGWVFPGQGSQHVGMGAGLESREARDTLTEASEVVGWDVLRVCRDGPAERLDSTEITQPAVVATSVAAARTLESLGLRPDAVAGHSVGEFAALVVAGAMRFEDAMRAVAVRGEAMLRAGRAHTGGMAAVLGLPAGRVEELCAAASGGVGPANLNGPEQVVVSGEDKAVAELAAAARAEGGRVIRLKVSVPAHSALMAPARDELARALEGVAFSAPRVRFFSGVTGRSHDRPGEIRELLVRGVTEPVRWMDAVLGMSWAGAELFVEAGPGEVLSGLLRRRAPDAETAHVGEDAEARELADRLVLVDGGRPGGSDR